MDGKQCFGYGKYAAFFPPARVGIVLCSVAILGILSPAFRSQAQTDDLLTELELLLEEDVVITASKTREHLLRAPATITVITADQIRNMGARNVTDVLKTLPGVETYIGEYGYTQVVIRGGRQEGERVKFMINGHSVNPPRTGQPALFFDDLTVENIRRIEVIRGPGSALYGTNALNGVVHILTKDAEYPNNYEMLIKGGSHNTWVTGIFFGDRYGDLNISGYGEYLETDGAAVTIEADAQTGLDQHYAAFGIAPVSLAPGETTAYRQKTDLNLDLRYHNFFLTTKYLKKIQGPYLGADFTLNNDSEWDLEYLFLEGQYAPFSHKNFDLLIKFSWDRVSEDYDIQGSPEGFTIPVDLDGDGDVEIFPEGRRGKLATSFDTFGGQLQGMYRLADTHTFIAGTEIYEILQRNNVAESNFDRMTVAALDPGEIDTTPSFDDNTRTLFALFLQDQWKIQETMELTLGIRYDHYSDFGSTTNPRAAFVWNVFPAMYLKFLYGRAFLAPSFHEYYLKNTPLIVGSQDLDPATMETFEIGAIYTISDYMTGSITYFYNNEDDVIIPMIQPDPNTPDTYTNSKGDRIQGIELEWNVDFENQVYGYVNYTYRETEARETHDDVPFASKHLAKFGLNVPLAHYFTANAQASVVGEKSREAGDPREPLESYWVVDATLIAKNFYKGWEVVASVHNLFDEEYDDPSLAGSFPGDYPKPGRQVWFGIRYNFTLNP